MIPRITLLVFFVFGNLIPLLTAQHPKAVSENKLSLDASPSPVVPLRKEVGKWQNNRFGMFIHWGPVSLTGKEISWSRSNSNTNCPNHGPTPVEEYDALYKRFNPTNFAASDWVEVAKEAGMKYMVFIAKHCDGFLFWDSKIDPYNIMNTPYRKDVCAELAGAALKAGMPLGWYFSPMDWRDPECRSKNNDLFVARMQSELKELLSNYGPISVLWFDTDAKPAVWHPETTYPLVRGFQPQIIIDNRLQLDSADQWRNQEKLKLRENEDFYTPEQKIGAYDDTQPWESCITLGTQWSWKPDDKIKTADEVLRILAKTAGGDGNLILNIGPMPDGRIEPRQVKVLRQVGDWLKLNGEGIYETRGGPYLPTEQYTSTRQGNAIFIHALKTKRGIITLPPLPAKITGASLIGGGSVYFEQSKDSVRFTLGDRLPSLHPVIRLQIDENSMLLPKIPAIQSQKSTP
jgi:alpha-L-fucosidase